VVDAVDRVRTELPFALRGIDADNGSEFINDDLLAYCKSHGIELTRSRPYQKNDQAWVEQKNGAIVRRLVGYGRLEGVAAAEALSRLYSASRLFVNFFQPSFKLAEKTRVGAKDLLARLQAECVGPFGDGQLRTLQRRVKGWRRSAACRLLFEENAGQA
jgi:hypothetical protein